MDLFQSYRILNYSKRYVWYKNENYDELILYKNRDKVVIYFTTTDKNYIQELKSILVLKKL